MIVRNLSIDAKITKYWIYDFGLKDLEVDI